MLGVCILKKVKNTLPHLSRGRGKATVQVPPADVVCIARGVTYCDYMIKKNMHCEKRSRQKMGPLFDGARDAGRRSHVTLMMLMLSIYST